jgi:carboxymethylenebutenolidase
VRVDLASGTPAELARPEGTPSRGLVIAPDIGGLRPLFDDMVARLSEENGWAVVAPEPFPGHEDMPLPERLTAVGELDDDRQVGDLVAAADLLGVEPVGLIGFCMGGMYALKAAATNRFDKVAAFYGMIRVPEQWRGTGHREPLDGLADRAVAERVLAIIGTADIWTPPGDVDALEATGATVVRYEDAEHGFVHDPGRDAHRAEDAADAWRRVVTWLGG